MEAAFKSMGRFGTRRWRWVLATATVLLVYAGVGFLLAPWVLHRQLERRLGATLQREVSIQRVRTNPFTLSVTIDGLLVKDRDGSPFISWERLFVKARLAPLVRREFDLATLQLIRLQARVSLARDGSLNFSDLLSSPSSPEPTPSAGKSGPSFVFGVDHLALVEAKLDFTDVSRPHPFHTTVGPFTVRLDNFRTRPDATSH